MQEKIRILLDTASRLEKTGMPYMLSGSMAVHLFGNGRSNWEFLIYG
jgi:hypothetical protein